MTLRDVLVNAKIPFYEIERVLSALTAAGLDIAPKEHARRRATITRQFFIGFVFAYLLGAIPMGVLIARMDKPAIIVAWSALTWPSILQRVSQAEIQQRDRRCDTPARYEAMREGADCSINP